MGAFLFEETFSVNLSKVTLVRPIINQPFTFRITSPTVLTYAIHFIGTAYLCPGEESCPACGSIGKRSLSLLTAGTNRAVALLELGQSTVAEMVAIQNQHSMKSLMDSTWSFVRKVAKRPLIPTLVSIKGEKPAAAVDDLIILRAFARLFNLPLPADDLTPSVYSEKIKPALVQKLERVLIR